MTFIQNVIAYLQNKWFQGFLHRHGPYFQVFGVPFQGNRTKMVNHSEVIQDWNTQQVALRYRKTITVNSIPRLYGMKWDAQRWEVAQVQIF